MAHKRLHATTYVRRKHREAANLVCFSMLVAAYVLIVMLSTGCAAKVPTSANQPGRKGTPIENALAYNASLAEANKTIAQLVIDSANGAGALIPVEAANRILIMQSKVADADRQLTPLLSDVGNLKLNGPRISSLLDEIRDAAGTLVSSGDLGIKDVVLEKRIAKGISNVYNMADVIINTLVQGNLIPAK